MRAPWPHQLKYAKALANKEIQGLWFCMRTGKTLTALLGTDDGDRLIICPNTVKGVWQDELLELGQNCFVHGNGPKPDKRPRNYIINYESLWRTNIMPQNWDSIIFDESLCIQNPRTKLWAYISTCLNGSMLTNRIICLSGTPCPEGYHQLINQSIACTGNYCGVRDPWLALRRFFTYDDTTYHWKINPGHAKEAKEQLHRIGPVMTQAEAGINTKKVYRTMRIMLSDHERNLWTGIDKRGMEPATLCIMAQSVASGRNPLGKIYSSTKLNAVADFVNEQNTQCVILTRFTESLLYLAGKIPNRYLIYGNDFGAAYRKETVAKFNKGEFKTIIANVDTVKRGLNLSAASFLIFAENSFSGETRIQAEERATVQGKEAVEIIDFVSIGSDEIIGAIDERILEQVRYKKDFNFRCLKAPAKGNP